MSDVHQAHEADEEQRQVALFRYGLIADFIHLARNHKGLYPGASEGQAPGA